MATLLDIADLRLEIGSADGALVPVDGVSLTVERGRTLALVGESGCGKTLTCLAVAGLLAPNVRRCGGRITLDGAALEPDAGEAAAVRRHEVGMIFQDPTGSLNPVRTIGWQVAEAFVLRAGLSRAAAERRAVELLELVGIPEPKRRARAYPHELSGGMNQRAMIAMAVAGDPSLLICDEATTALDVTIQAQILDLLRRLQRELAMAIVFVTHDLATVAQMADEVAVMYAGRVVEHAPLRPLFKTPRHPYTYGLLASLPGVDDAGGRLATIPGTVPPLWAMPEGCRFAPRCGRASARCRAEAPALEPLDRATRAACFHPVGP
jgi:oligopeptide/dipeptide ABC transporter ATP-binding protein